MRALRPLERPGLFLRALNSGDVDAVVSLYEPDGVIAADPNQVAVGHAAIRALVAGFLIPRPRFELHDSEVVQSGDVTLVRARWTVAQPGPAKTAGVMSIRPSLARPLHLLADRGALSPDGRGL
jgi:ketosteroid isomerase-like protein